MQNILFLAIGGATGTLLRYSVIVWFARMHFNALPYGTLTVNLAGSLLIGFFWGILGGNPSEAARHLLFLGILGGFTTFSSYALESMNLVRNGQVTAAIAYVLISNIVGLLLVASGFWAGKQLV